jgi:hypothetical protein
MTNSSAIRVLDILDVLEIDQDTDREIEIQQMVRYTLPVTIRLRAFQEMHEKLSVMHQEEDL